MNFKKVCMAAVMTAVTLAGGSTVNGQELKSGEQQPVGYSFNAGAAGVTFNSWEDYVKYSPEAAEVMKDDTYECYMKSHDFIYIPKEYEDKTDDISSIFITPEYYRITFDADGNKTEFCCYFYAGDNNIEPFGYTSAKKNGEKSSVGNTALYETDNEWESNIYFKYENSFFSVSTGFEFQTESDVRAVKLFTDSHFLEKDGSLFYISDKGKRETGWKELNGHRYYFRSKDGSAVCGGLADIGGVVYSFNDNGVCNGAYTGYGLTGDGSRVYYRDGKISDDIR